MLALVWRAGPMAVRPRDSYPGTGSVGFGVGVGTGVGVGVGTGVGEGVGVGCGPFDSTMSTCDPFATDWPSLGTERITVPMSAAENAELTAPSVRPAWVKVLDASSLV